MKDSKRSYQDRRTPISRRKGYDLKEISTLGKERRKNDRRSKEEKREDWVRVEGSESSVPNYL